MDLLGRPRTDIWAIRFGFATSARTKANAVRVRLGVSFKEIDITPCRGRCWPISFRRWPRRRGVTFENVQAGLRTDYLFRLINHLGGIVLGTGDLSDSRWGGTYGVGDQMSHYAVNTGVPKTMIQHLIR